MEVSALRVVVICAAVFLVAAAGYHDTDEIIGRRSAPRHGRQYDSRHGHKLDARPYHDCFPLALKLCAHPTASMTEHVKLSIFMRCIVEKRTLLPKSCAHWIDGQADCAADVDLLCPNLNMMDTLDCIDEKYVEVSQKCRSSDWYKQQFPHDHARMSRPKHHYDPDMPGEEDLHAARKQGEGYVTPESIHDELPDEL